MQSQLALRCLRLLEHNLDGSVLRSSLARILPQNLTGSAASCSRIQPYLNDLQCPQLTLLR